MAIEVPSTDGVRLHVHDWPGRPGAPTVVAVHGAGLHGAVFGPLAAALGAQPPGLRVVAPDLRAHGWSTRPDHGALAWPGFAYDVLAVVRGLGLERPLGLGHSMGGAAMVLAEARAPGTFAALHLFEPVIFPPGALRPGSGDPGNPLAAGARRRRRRFASHDEAVEVFRAKPPLRDLRADALEAYVAHGLVPDGEGGLVLACDPEDEAQLYERGAASGAFDVLAQVRCPVVVTSGDDGTVPGVWGAAIAAALPQGRHHVVPGVQHFGPLQDPDRIAADAAATFAAAPGVGAG